MQKQQLYQTSYKYFQVFESHDTNVSNEQWVLHFNSEQEKIRFIKSLSDCWKTHFEVILIKKNKLMGKSFRISDLQYPIS